MKRWTQRLGRGPGRLCWTIGLALSLLLISGCAPFSAEADPRQEGPAADPEAGRMAMQAYGCGACHLIPGVTGANSLVGPPLTAWTERSYIAGSLPNEPVYLEEWIRFPQSIEPGTAMPDMNVTEEDARNMGAYLYTLEKDTPWYTRALWLVRN